MPLALYIMSLRTTLVVALMVSLSAQVSAQALTDPTLSRARVTLARYDFFGDDTFGVIAELGSFIERAQRDVELAGHTDSSTLREARFLHAMAAADLTLLAEFRREPALRTRIAAAYGVTEDVLVQRILADLSRVEVGVYAPVVRDARQALQLIAGHAPDWTVPGERRDALYVAAASRAATATDPVAALATLGTDPCASNCAGIFARFDAEGRRAIDAVQKVFIVLDRLAQRGDGGDPFSRALSVDVVIDRLAFRGLVLEPEPVLAPEFGLSAASANAAALRPDAVVSVHPHEIRVGFLPRVTFESGRAEALAAGSPILPEFARIAIPGSLRPFPTAIDSVSESLRTTLAGAQQVAVGGAPDAEAHLLTRVWLSCDDAGFTPNALVGVGSSGELRGVAARAIHGDDDSAMQVYLRYGGHTVSRPGGAASDIPRLHTADGMRFDWSTLSEYAHDTRSASVRFMGGVSFATFAQTAFVVGQGGRPVTIVLP